MNTWNFSVQRAGSTRVEDGVWFEATLNPSRDVWDLNMPEWVWLVHWPNPSLPPVWVDPVKRGLDTASDVERYIDVRWPVQFAN